MINVDIGMKLLEYIIIIFYVHKDILKCNFFGKNGFNLL